MTGTEILSTVRQNIEEDHDKWFKTLDVRWPDSIVAARQEGQAHNMFRWGIIGSGYVARKFVLGLRSSADAKAVLVHSRRAENARAFARDFSLPTVADTLEEAIRHGEVDALYIATPPSVHKDQAIACLRAGKPVLLEKPFAASWQDAQAIAEVARSTGVFCMEGMWTRFLPLMAELRKLIASRAIGDLRSFYGSFGATNRPETADNRFHPDMGGGALAHRGIYPIAMALDLLGAGTLASATVTWGETGVDEDNVLVLRHDNGALSTIRSSLRAPLANDFSIEGTKGSIHVHAPIYRPFRFTLTQTTPSGHSRGGNPKVEAIREGTLAQSVRQYADRLIGSVSGRGTQKVFSGNGYHYEAAEVARCVAAGAGESAIMPLSASMSIAKIMEEALASSRGGEPGADA